MAINATDARLGELQALQGRAAAFKVDDDQAFVGLVADCARVLELTEQQIADGLGVSRPTVNRWSRGANLPHRLMRGPIAQWIAGQAGERVRVRLRPQRHRASA